jgi:AcrR family transcriptional regulator
MNKEDTAPDTRDALVLSGRKLFSDKGFDGASVRDITAGAGANLGSITYHFGSKERLYEAVVSSTIAPLAERLLATVGGPGDPLDRVEAVVREYFAYLIDHPEMPRLFIRSLLASGMPPAPAQEHLKRILAALVGLIREGQAIGRIRPGHPALMALGLMSHSLHLTIMRPALARMAGFDLDDPTQRGIALDHIVRTVRGGLALRQEGPA